MTTDLQRPHKDSPSMRGRQEVFDKLRPLTSQLLMCRNDSISLHGHLLQLQEVVQGADPKGLLGCWDYAVFPILMMLDSMVAACAPSSAQAGGAGGQEPPAIPAMRSERAAGALLGRSGGMVLLCVCGSTALLMQLWAVRLFPLHMDGLSYTACI